MGVFELAPYAAGTRTVASAMTEGTAFTVVGGGDTGAAIRLAEALLGSVGQYCVHHAPCPVVIMRGKAGAHA